ncbi:MAG: hypothetical protein KDE51_03630, partial [Anaerolineales bacterium]|nr:hypothetical protein [Anaerolineales bacterium]
TLSFTQTALLLLIILTMMGGFIGSLAWWFDDPASFSWDLPPLASRMLAAAGWSFAVGCWFVLERPTLARLRLLIWMLIIYLVPLTIAILFFHLGRFDWQAPITYAFFVIVLSMIGAAVWQLFYPTGIVSTKNDLPADGLLRVWLWGAAVLTAMWGVALFLTDAGPSALIWVWPGDLLTSRLIAVMLWTIATAAVFSLRSTETVPVTLDVLTVYGVGVVAANLWAFAAAKPLYVGVFALLAIGSAAFWWRGREARVLS